MPWLLCSTAAHIVLLRSQTTANYHIMRGKNDFDCVYLIENVVLKHVQEIEIRPPLDLLLVRHHLLTVVADSVEQKPFSLPLTEVINDDF